MNMHELKNPKTVKNVKDLTVGDKVYCEKTKKKVRVAAISNGMYVNSKMIKLSNGEEFSMNNWTQVLIY